ncbi:transcriptional regulator [Comamonas serinivorans]|uniref:Transcriptional regulator n=1 Tax=Comamonas serinivorans TaxID=1082851 RepID=A0A1Y0EPR5_9BURK|nr:TfoX/Sxy family protein [Comamonas serinivorans]ARU05299.1 transcriptional regulator [Comamonas serinivorans]
MPSPPLSPETLRLMDAVREALSTRHDVDERRMFGVDCFFVAGKLCLGVKHGELLVRLPPERHDEFLEMPGTRALSPGGGMTGYIWVEPDGFATRAQWQLWLREALAYNPRAKASPRRKPAARRESFQPDEPGAKSTPTRRKST